MPHELGRKRGIADMAGLAASVRPCASLPHFKARRGSKLRLLADPLLAFHTSWRSCSYLSAGQHFLFSCRPQHMHHHPL